jgi:hypothetical protein
MKPAKVWIVCYNDYDGLEVDSVWSTEVLALKEQDRLNNTRSLFEIENGGFYHLLEKTVKAVFTERKGEKLN